MKRLAIFLSILVLLFVALSLGSGNAAIGVRTVDAGQGAPFNPHGRYSATTNSCTTCHVPHQRTADPETPCYGCHPSQLTHQKETCATCHDPHGRTGNAALVQASIGGKTVSFDGKNFDSTANSICRTCHTTTTYHSPAARATHYENQSCTKCHPHSAGFAPDPTNCGVCHGDPPDSGAHARHRQTDIGLKNCESCHPRVRNWRDPGHYNGRVDFKDKAVLSSTGVCNDCHGNTSGIAEAKTNWPAGRAISDCTGCHNSADPGKLNGKAAPAVDAYWATNGHGQGHEQDRDLDCQACHNPAAPHFDAADNPRLWDAPARLCDEQDRQSMKLRGSQCWLLFTRRPPAAPARHS